MKSQLEERLLSEKRAKALYKYLLSKGQEEEAEKINEFYDLGENKEQTLDYMYKSFIIAGKNEKAEELSQTYHLNKNLEENLSLVSQDQYKPLAKQLYQHYAHQMHSHHNKLLNLENSSNIEVAVKKIEYNNKRQQAYNTLQTIQKNTRFGFKPDADFNDLLDVRKNKKFRESIEHFLEKIQPTPQLSYQTA